MSCNIPRPQEFKPNPLRQRLGNRRMKPLLAHKYEPHRITYPCIGQPKLNGIRAIYQSGKFYSRDFERWEDSVVAHIIKELLEVFPSSSVVLDGEFYVHGWLLQQINGAIAVNRLNPNDRTPLVQYHVFDVVDHKESFLARTFGPFNTIIGSRLKCVFAVKPTPLYDAAQADRYYNDVVAQGYEGMMYRLGDCPYTVPKQFKGVDQKNRCFHLLKRKDWHDDEFRIVAVLEGKETDKGGKFINMLGAFVCENSSGHQFKVGVLEGFTNEDRLQLWNNPPVGKLLIVKYLTLTEDNVPFNARAIAIRS